MKGKPIVAIRLGSGPTAVAFIGNIHGGWEPRAYEVIEFGLEQFRSNPSQVPSTASLYFIPSMNPDGYEDGKPLWVNAEGTGGPGDQVLARTAFNANGVDLNRNFGTSWSPNACGGERVRLRENPDCFEDECRKGCAPGLAGRSAFSEPETQAYRDFVLSRRIRVTLTYHESRFPSVSIREGGGGPSEPFAKRIAAMFGYEYLPAWPDYPVTGQAQDWLDANGVVGAEIELQYRNDAPFDAAKNLTAMKMALDRALAG